MYIPNILYIVYKYIRARITACFDISYDKYNTCWYYVVEHILNTQSR